MHTIICNFAFLGIGLLPVWFEQLFSSGCVRLLLCSVNYMSNYIAGDVMTSILTAWCLEYSFTLGLLLINQFVIYG
jgi:hypothetical protein